MSTRWSSSWWGAGRTLRWMRGSRRRRAPLLSRVAILEASDRDPAASAPGHSESGQVVGPVNNERRGLLDDGRANRGVTNATRGTESQLKGGKLLTQEPEFASKPGPLQLMMQMSAHAVGALMLCDQSLGGEIIGRYNEAHHNGAATVSVHDSWAGFLKQLSAYRWIETLTLLLHSRPGEFLFHPSP